jgi:iron complex outermembrane recepter protein
VSFTSPITSSGFQRFSLGPILGRSLAAVLLASHSFYGQEASREPDKAGRDLTQVSMEGLMNLEVTSASKKEQKLSEVPAALFVITQEDIRHSAAANIPDLLRIVPGLDVAQISASTWAISARGFNLQFANKLLVLMDGRAVYTPLFGGVYWDAQDVPLEDIDRIEVICGPGGTVWGANAVNGVINVITKKTDETQGALATLGGGNVAQAFSTLQYGGQIGENTTYRAFTKYLNNNQSPGANGQEAHDDWHLLHGGFRSDTKLSNKDSFTLQGDIYTGSEGANIVHSVFTPPENLIEQEQAEVAGGNVLGRWVHVFSRRWDTTLQVYFDRYRRDGPESDETRDTFDIDFENHLALGSRQDLILGFGYRDTADETLGTVDQAFVPPNQDAELFSAFAQDQITLKRDRLNLYVGTKLENNYFTSFDLQPSVRLAWTPSLRRTFWGAVSRASRTPTRRDENLNAALAALPGPAEVVLLGNPNFRSEHVIAYELGYRAQPNDRLSVAVSLFLNAYDHLESIEPQPPVFSANSAPPLFLLPRVLGNTLHATTDGAEGYLHWKLTKRWTISPGYSLLQMHVHNNANSLDTVSVQDIQGSSPRHQAQLRSRLELLPTLSCDLNAYFVDRLKAAPVTGYTKLDSQMTWRFGEAADFSIVGQNLLQDHHFEFNDFLQSVNSAQVKRSAYAKISWRF